jgi:hypothetical protein
VGIGARATITSFVLGPLLMAFAPAPRPWAPTPERFLRTVSDHPAPIVSKLIAEQGFEVYSYRPDGTVAIVWGAPRTAPVNLSPDGASQLALELAQAMARSLGVKAEDLYVRDTHPLEGWTNVAIGQQVEGIDVPQGFVMFTFREGQVAAIRNELVRVRVDLLPTLTPDVATQVAIDAAKGFTLSTLVAPAALEVWTAGDRAEDVRLAYAVKTRSEHPVSRFTFHVDAHDGTILAADDAVHFAEGEGRVRIVVDTVTSGGAQDPHTALFLGLDQDTDSDGESQLSSRVTATYEGPYVRIRDESGTPVERFDVDLSGPYGVYDHTPTLFSQADPFVHLNLVKLYTAQITPTLGWIGRQLTSNVNINDNCNAFWDGQTVNFFRSGGGCNNTGRIASIIYHEYGHGYHGNLTGRVVGSIGEGSGDFLAGTILDDPIVGRGFATNGSGIRRMDQPQRYPDDYTGEVHQDGLIWATALWELRQALLTKHGAWAGQMAVDEAFVLALTQGPGLSTAYPAILSADDDDNNPNNGTPNSCEINAIFSRHGLIDGGQINHDAVPTRAFVRITHDAPGRIAVTADGMPIAATTENRSDCGTYDPAALTLHYAIGDGAPFTVAPDATLIPGAVEGDTVRYYFTLEAEGVTYALGDETSPFVALADFADETIFEEGFEGDFGAWQHGTVGSDLHDDWEVGAPLGLRFDPTEAHSGNAVAGTDLGAGGGVGGTNGAAKGGRSTFLESEAITTEGMENLRLELWHHYVVDGSLRVVVDGETVFTYANDGSAWSGGWRYLTFELPAATADRADGFTIRFEVDTNANNNRGGWTLDDIRVSGTAIPPPPPPPPPEDPPTMNPDDPKNPGTPPATEDPSIDPVDPADPAQPDDGTFRGLRRGGLSGGCVCADAPRDTRFSGWAWVMLGVFMGVIRRSRRSRRLH